MRNKKIIKTNVDVKSLFLNSNGIFSMYRYIILQRNYICKVFFNLNVKVLLVANERIFISIENVDIKNNCRSKMITELSNIRYRLTSVQFYQKRAFESVHR